MESDRSYYERRAAEEHAAAAASAHPRVRAAHLEMAERYGERLSEIAAKEPSNVFPLVGAA